MSQEATDLLKTVPDAVIAKSAAATTMSGSGIAVVGSYTLNEVAMVVGMIVGGLGVLIQLVVAVHSAILKIRQDRRAAILNNAKLEALKRGSSLADVEAVETRMGDL